MKLYFKLLILLTAFVFSSASLKASAQALQPALTNDQLKNKLMNELDFVADTFGRFYAPQDWKAKYLNWNLETQRQIAHSKIQSATSVAEYRDAMVGFLSSTADYHVGSSFASTEKSSLPFQLKTINSKSLVIWIDRTKLPEDRFDLALGDEVLAFNGRPIADILAEILNAKTSNVPGTDLALADMNLTSRSGRRNLPVEKGPITIQFKKAKDQSTSEFQMIWDYTKELIPGERLKTQNKPQQDGLKFSLPQMISPATEGLTVAENPFGIGLRKSFLPDFGTRIWETASSDVFDAYIFQNDDGKLIGVIRIPSYTPPNVDKAVDSFIAIIKKMQPITSGLIIDQVNNPGGSVFYLYTLASILTDKAIQTPKHRMSMNSSQILECAQIEELKKVTDDAKAVEVLGKRFHGYPTSYQLAQMIQNYCEFMLSEWSTGKKLTDPYFLWGVDQINPHPEARYTKPIIVLVNELDFSGGDFFPTILQDNKRAQIMGTRTAGAGGYVHSVEFPNSFGLTRFSYTGSIAERLDKQPIENLGVTPDLPLIMTENDYLNKFQDYKASVKEAIKKLVQAP